MTREEEMICFYLMLMYEDIMYCGLFVPSASAKGAGIYLLFVSLTPLKGAEIIMVRGEVLPKFYSVYNTYII